MIVEISCIAVGIPIGHFLKNQKLAIQGASFVMSWSIKLLLFLLGLALGSNEELIAQLDILGIQSLTLGACIILGSIIGAKLADKYLDIDKLLEINVGKK